VSKRDRRRHLRIGKHRAAGPSNPPGPSISTGFRLQASSASTSRRAEPGPCVGMPNIETLPGMSQIRSVSEA
jgi:hypothetical protein